MDFGNFPRRFRNICEENGCLTDPGGYKFYCKFCDLNFCPEHNVENNHLTPQCKSLFYEREIDFTPADEWLARLIEELGIPQINPVETDQADGIVHAWTIPTDTVDGVVDVLQEAPIPQQIPSEANRLVHLVPEIVLSGWSSSGNPNRCIKILQDITIRPGRTNNMVVLPIPSDEVEEVVDTSMSVIDLTDEVIDLTDEENSLRDAFDSLDIPITNTIEEEYSITDEYEVIDLDSIEYNEDIGNNIDAEIFMPLEEIIIEVVEE